VRKRKLKAKDWQEVQNRNAALLLRDHLGDGETIINVNTTITDPHIDVTKTFPLPPARQLILTTERVFLTRNSEELRGSPEIVWAEPPSRLAVEVFKRHSWFGLLLVIRRRVDDESTKLYFTRFAGGRDRLNEVVNAVTDADVDTH
jgi:hypothetical protein